MPLPDGSTQVFAAVTRFSALDVNGFVAAGSSTFTTDQLIKATAAPTKETGVDLATVNANGDLVAHYKKGDMAKYYAFTLEIATTDPILKAILTGGTVLTDTTAALGLVTGTAAAGQITGGILPAGTYGYRTTQFNGYGETVAAAEVTATVVSGVAGAVVVSGAVMASTALGWVVYGRQPGGEQYLAKIPNIGTQATSAASGVGSPTTIAVTALTKPIPAGFTFQVTGDTNTTKTVFTVTQAAGVGATALAVSVSQTITTTIAAGTIVPVFVDTGALTPSGTPPVVDSSAGPGLDVGYQSPRLGVVGNPNGVSIEMWARMTLNGTTASYLPYQRWVFPKVANLIDESREFGPTLQLPMFAGEAFENPNWGSGPTGDWQFDSSRVFQYVRCSSDVVPPIGLSPVGATF